MAWWYWIIVGILLLALELFSPGGFFMFLIGLAAIITGLPGLIGIDPPFTFQVLLFTALSALLLVTTRKPLQRLIMRKGPELSDEFSGKEVVVTSDIASGQFGKGEFRGSPWNVRNNSAATLLAGSRCTIERADGLTLIVNK